MIIKRNKKGAVELSLNLIIMLIIGMVVLGLVIGFVNSLVNKGAANFDKQLGANEKLKIDKVKACPDNLCLDPYPSATMKLKGDLNIFIKIRNSGSTTQTISAGSLSQLTGNILHYSLKKKDGVDTAETDFDNLAGPGFSVNTGESEAHRYILTAKDASIGIYFLTLTWGESSKTITINVK